MTYSNNNTRNNLTYSSTHPTVRPMNELPVCSQFVCSVNHNTLMHLPLLTYLFDKGSHKGSHLSLFIITNAAYTMFLLRQTIENWSWLVIHMISSHSINLSCTASISLEHQYLISRDIGMHFKKLHQSTFPKHSMKLICSHTSVSDSSESLSSSL